MQRGSLQIGTSNYTNQVLLAAAEAELAELGEPLPPDQSPIISLDRLELMWHLTARVGVRLREGASLIDIFKVLFPPLAVTGVPKPEAMGVIATTEDTPRGAYCGAIGFLAPHGAEGTTASFSVAVRTVVIDNEEGVAEYGVGTAIASVPDVATAYDEARLKARVLVDRRPDFQLVERFRSDDGEIAGLGPKIEHPRGLGALLRVRVQPRRCYCRGGKGGRRGRVSRNRATGISATVGSTPSAGRSRVGPVRCPRRRC